MLASFSEVKCCCLVVKSCLTLLQPHRLLPARLLCPWDLPSKNTGVGCHFLLWESSQPRYWTWISYVGWQLFFFFFFFFYPLSHLETRKLNAHPQMRDMVICLQACFLIWFSSHAWLHMAHQSTPNQLFGFIQSPSIDTGSLAGQAVSEKLVPGRQWVSWQLHLIR